MIRPYGSTHCLMAMTTQVEIFNLDVKQNNTVCLSFLQVCQV